MGKFLESVKGNAAPRPAAEGDTVELTPLPGKANLDLTDQPRLNASPKYSTGPRSQTDQSTRTAHTNKFI